MGLNTETALRTLLNGVSAFRRVLKGILKGVGGGASRGLWGAFRSSLEASGGSLGDLWAARWPGAGGEGKFSKTIVFLADGNEKATILPQRGDGDLHRL